MLGETNCARLNETHMTIFFATAGTKIGMLAACGAPRGKTLMRVLCVKEQLISIPLDRRASRCDRSLIRSNVSSHARDSPITTRSSMSSRYQLIGKISGRCSSRSNDRRPLHLPLAQLCMLNLGVECSGFRRNSERSSMSVQRLRGGRPSRKSTRHSWPGNEFSAARAIRGRDRPTCLRDEMPR